MADTHSSSFKRLADVAERSMDSYFSKSPMAEIYDYAAVSELWEGSVGCFARIYLKPPTASTPQDIKDIYTSVQSGLIAVVQKLEENLQNGQDFFSSYENKVRFNIRTINIIVFITTTPTVSDMTTMTVTTNINPSSSVTETTALSKTTEGTSTSSVAKTTSASSAIATVNGTVGATVSIGTTTSNGAGVTTSIGMDLTTTPSVGNTITSPSSGTTTADETVQTTLLSQTTTISLVNSTSSPTSETVPGNRTVKTTLSGQTTASNGIGVTTVSSVSNTTFSGTSTVSQTVATTTSSRTGITDTSSAMSTTTIFSVTNTTAQPSSNTATVNETVGTTTFGGIKTSNGTATTFTVTNSTTSPSSGTATSKGVDITTTINSVTNTTFGGTINLITTTSTGTGTSTTSTVTPGSTEKTTSSEIGVTTASSGTQVTTTSSGTGVTDNSSEIFTTAETTPADASVVSTDAVFYIVDRELTGNFSDRFSEEYLTAAALIEEEIRLSFADTGEGEHLKDVSDGGFWLKNRLTEATLTWKAFNITDLQSLKEKFTTIHEARVQNGKSNISLHIESITVKQLDDCPHIFPDACDEFMSALNASGLTYSEVCGNYAAVIQCLYFTYQSEGLSLCNKSTLDQNFKHYSTLVMNTFGANITSCDGNITHVVKPVDLAVWVKFIVRSAEWDDMLKDKTSSQFKHQSDMVTDVVSQTDFNITVLEIISFNRDGEAVTVSAILNIIADNKVDITTLTMQLNMSLQFQQQFQNMTLLELIGVEWVKDLTVILRNTELWAWYDSKWNPVCQRSFPPLAADVVCRQLGYERGLVYQGLFKENALELSNLTCNGSIAQNSLTECSIHFDEIDLADCVVTNVNCFNTLMHYELVGGGDATYGYVRVTWDNKDGLLCSSDDPSDAMATYLCRDMNSAFYGGSILQSIFLQKPAETNIWQVDATCYRPETDSKFSDCVQSGWQFIQNASYHSSSVTEPIEQPPFMPDSCPLNNTWYGTTKSPDKIPDYVVSDTCLVKVYCHLQPVAIYQGPESNSGYIFATNSSDPLIFCRDNFTNQEAAAACKTLRYTNGGMSLKFNPVPWFNPRTSKYSSYDYQCSENETIHECNKTERDITLDCSGPAVVKCVDDAATYKEWDMKIDKDGYTLLLYYKGQWGTICDAGTKKPWTTKEATVVCRQLGYTHGVPRSLSLLPAVSLPHVITRVTCSDSAAKLSDCTYVEVTDDSCINSYAAEVFCYNSSDVASLELVRGPEFNSGLVKVTWQNIEGYLCTWSLDTTAATVMCRSFGFISGVQDTNINFTDPHLQYIWQTDFDGQCNTNEVLAETCRSATWVRYAANLSQADMKCVCKENYISLYCYGKVKVSLEPRKSFGPLLIYDGSDYYPVCRDKINQNAANAACREVNKLNTSNAVILYPGTFLFGEVAKDASFACADDAISVSDCVAFSNGFDFDCLVASVLCYEGEETPGPSPENATEWRIENSVVHLKAYGVWGTVCSEEWTKSEATTLCMTISSEYTIGFAETDTRLPMEPMWLRSVICDSNATDINLCARKTFLESSGDYCQFGGTATAICFRGESDVPKFKLSDTEEIAFYVKGHLSVIRNNLTGYFCPSDKSVVESHADQLCKIMGYIGGQLSQVKISRNEYSLVWIDSYVCNWNIPECFLNGNFTEGRGTNYTDTDEGSDMNGEGNSTSDTTRNLCDLLVPDILCFNSKVRLDVPESPEGFLLINRQSGWKGVCFDDFSLYLAEKLCVEAGYQSGNYSAASASDAGLQAGFGDVICHNDTKFEDCIFNESSLDCDEIVYISCSHLKCAGDCTLNENSTASN